MYNNDFNKLKLETFICKNCDRELPSNAFGSNRFGRLLVCKDCVATKRKLNHTAKVNAKEQQQIDLMQEITKKRLSDFTSRELLEELKTRGYKWDNMTVLKIIDYDKI